MGGDGLMQPGLDPSRVAELLVKTGGGGPGRRGSGYRVSASNVLTAAHVVSGGTVKVRFDADRPGEWIADADVAFLDRRADVAVLVLKDVEDAGVSPVSYGRLGDRDAVVSCAAVGFPLFKLRTERRAEPEEGPGKNAPWRYRDTFRAVGTIAVLSNRREGTLEVTVQPPERDPDRRRSPWQGMSGAAVWSGNKIVGVVSEHHRSDGLGRLSATRVDRWYEILPPGKLGRLLDLLGLPHQMSDLDNVIRPSGEETAQARHRARLRDLAPGLLTGRDQELADLVRFCSGDEPYQWWRGRPWAGKTALAAWFALNPPAGVSIASFFATGQLPGQADSDAFTDAMIEQLAALAGQPIPDVAKPQARDGERRRLLELAAARVGDKQERLLLLVDGLDEDQGAKPASGMRSIASLLPERPPKGVRVLVTSRTSLGIPADVADKHPLRTCGTRQLRAFAQAGQARMAAERELLEQLHADQLQADLVAFITASGGGLTPAELAELSGRPVYLLRARLDSTLGRSFAARSVAGAGRDDRVYLFAHKTLRAVAERQLSQDLGSFRERLHEWAGTYRSLGWPPRTPQYLLRPYGRFLIGANDARRLAICATDAARHDRIFQSTGTDAAALAEISASRQQLRRQSVPDLTTLALLSLQEGRLADRNEAMPVGLPKVLGLLGRARRGEEIARSIPDPKRRAHALLELASGMAQTDQKTAIRLADAAADALRAEPDPEERVRAITGPIDGLSATDLRLARRMAAVAEEAFDAIGSHTARESVAYSLVRWLSEIAEWDRAEHIIRVVNKNYSREGEAALGRLAEMLARAGEIDRARQVIVTLAEPEERAEALARIAEAIADGNRDQAARLADDAAQAALEHGNGWTRSQALQRLATLLANIGEWDRAADAIRHIVDPKMGTEALTYLVTRLATADPPSAASLVSQADEAALNIAYRPYRVTALSGLASGLAQTYPDRAIRWAAEADDVMRLETSFWDRISQEEAVIAGFARVDPGRAGRTAGEAAQETRGIADPAQRTSVLNRLVTALSAAGPGWVGRLADEAEDAASGIVDAEKQSSELKQLVDGLAAAREWDRAEQAARAITVPWKQEEALRGLYDQLAGVGDWDRAERVARAEQATGRSPYHPALRDLAERLAATAEWDRAVQAAGAISDPGWQSLVRRELVERLAGAGEWDRAESLCGSITNLQEQAWARGEVAKGLAKAGLWDRAVRVARSIPAEEDGIKARLLTDLVSGLAGTERARAMALADEAEGCAHAIRYLSWRAHVLCGLAEALIQVDRDRALRTVEAAEQVARDASDRERQRMVLPLVMALAVAGEWDRAEEASEAIFDLQERCQALLGLASRVSATEPDRERRLIDVVEREAGSLTEPWRQTRAVKQLVKWLAEASQWDRATHLASGVSGPDERADVQTGLVAAMAQADPDRASALAWDAAEAARAIAGAQQRAAALSRLAELAAPHPDDRRQFAEEARLASEHIEDPSARAQALSHLVTLMAGVDPEWALPVVTQAMQAAVAITEPQTRAVELRRLMQALTQMSTGDRLTAWLQPDRIGVLAAEAVQVARAVTDPLDRDLALSWLVDVLTAARQWDGAAEAARAITDPKKLADALTTVVGGLAGLRAYPLGDERVWNARVAAENVSRVLDLAGHAAQAALTIPDPSNRLDALRHLSRLLASIGDWDHAEETARAIADDYERLAALARIAVALVTIDPRRADRLMAEAEQAARLVANPDWRRRALAGLADGLAEPWEWDYAERAERVIADRSAPAWELRNWVEDLASRGHWDRAARAVQAITEPRWRAEARNWLAEALLAAQEWERAERAIGAVARPGDRASLLIGAAARLARSGIPWALTLPAQAEQAARAITDPDDQALALSNLAAVIARTDQDRAERLVDEVVHSAQALTDPHLRADILSMAAVGLIETDRSRAERLADQAQQIGRALPDPRERVGCLSTLIETLASVDASRIGQLADDAEHAVAAIADPRWRVQGFLWLLDALGSDDPDRAARIAEEAEKAARGLPHHQSRSRARHGLAEIVARIDSSRLPNFGIGARRASSTITDTRWQAEERNWLVIGPVNAEEYDRAEDAAHAIDNLEERASALSLLADAIAATDMKRAHALADHAEHAAHDIDDPEKRSVMLIGLAQDLAGLGEARSQRLAAAAQDAARAIANPHLQARALGQLTDRLTGIGDWDGAEYAALSISLQEARASRLRDLSQQLVKAHEWDRAVHVTCAIPESKAREDSLVDLAKSLFNARKWEQLQQLAEAVTEFSSFQSVLAFTEVLAECHRNGPAGAKRFWMQRGSQLLAPHIEGSRFPETLPVLAELAPDTIRAVHDFLFKNSRSPENAGASPRR